MLIVGLGNPGIKYKNTFHNMGYLVVDALAKLLDKKVNRIECCSLTASFSVNSTQIILAKPTTYMNLSGQAVKSLMVKYNQKEEDLVVIYDDIDLPRFSARVRENGSAGTHNGMKNIVEVINSQNFKRIRMGIGKNDYDLKDYVLSKINSQDKKLFEVAISEVAKLISDYIADKDFEKVMRIGNTIGKK
ncbi:aminoacyl-tRNA hydrolase [bacterium]|nr:aminoacyl-tRNA hydrolase [bacterium]